MPPEFGLVILLVLLLAVRPLVARPRWRARDSRCKKTGILLAMLWSCILSGLTACGSGSRGDGGTHGVLDVAADGTATYRTIQAAIDAAAPNTVIRIAAGTYSGPIEITKPIVLQGADWRRTKLMADYADLGEVLKSGGVPAKSRKRLDDLAQQLKRTDGDKYAAALSALRAEFGPKPTVSITKSRGVVLKSLSISMQGKVREGAYEAFPMVLVKDAAVCMTDCVLAGSPVLGLQVSGTSQVECRNCLIAGIRGTGIVVDVPERSRVHIADSEVRHCGYSGITIKGRGDTTIDNCRIGRMEFHGVRYDNASPTISGSVFFDMNRGGVYANGDTHATIRDNLFLGCALSTWGRNRDLIELNTFAYRSPRKNAAWGGDAAIVINGDSLPTICANVISQYEHGLILPAKGNSGFVLKDNIFDTRDKPIVRWSDAKPSKLEEVPLPERNRQASVRFVAPDKGDYSVVKDQSGSNTGARRFATVESRWPETPEERELLDRLSKAESARR